MEEGGMNLLTIYDLQNSYIAYSAPVAPVMNVIYKWNSFNVISQSGKVFQLKEMGTKQKLEILFRKNLYDLAISIAKKRTYKDSLLANIYAQYGHHLCQKGDYDMAVAQYIHTIGYLEASYVIRKFLDAQRIPQLTDYLEALHKQGFANKDHTSILLNCYTKLSDSAKLEQFISGGQTGEMAFDVDTAIKVLRDANYAAQALTLARVHGRHRLFLRIQLDDRRDHAAALDYIDGLEPELAEAELKQYGKILLKALPERTTELVKKLCREGDPEARKAKAEQFIPLFLSDDSALQSFLEHIVHTDPELAASNVHNTLLELYMGGRAGKDGARSEDVLRYLQDSEGRIGLDHALILCHLNDFSPGMPYIFAKTNLTKEILLHHMDQRDYGAMVETCKQYDMEELWLETLWFFARSPECPTAHISALLQHVEKHHVLPPLVVLEILSHSSTVTFSVVKDYLLRWLKKEKELTQQDSLLLQQYQQDTKQNQEIVNSLETEGQIFQVFRCSACDHPLELPTVHFLCKHSFHQHCFESYADNDTDCPVCAPEKKEIQALLTRYTAKEKLQAPEESENAAVLISKYLVSYLFEERGKTADLPRTPATPVSSTNPFDD